MSGDQLTALLPLLILGGTVVFILLTLAVKPSRGVTVWATNVGLLLAALSGFFAARLAPQEVTPLLVIDGYALFYQVLLIAATLAVALLSADYLRRQDVRAEEFCLLLLLATLGGGVLTASRHFASLFLGIETLTIGLYALLGYVRGSRRSTEAAVKYLILAGAASAVLLFGMALLYARLGTLDFAGTAAALAGRTSRDPFLLVGATLLIAGIGFKLALVPLHWWTPDVYEGAPAPVTAYVASISKGAVFALLLRFVVAGGVETSALAAPLYVLAAASMLGGNILALLQDNVKRLLAYSSIAHLGYALVPLLAGGDFATQAATFYILAYIVTILIAFGVVSVLSAPDHDAGALEEYRGLFARNAPLALLLTASLLSLAGIPLTAGFVAKFQVAAAGASAALWILLVILAVSSAIGIFYYLRVIVALLSSPEPATPAAPRVRAVPATLLAALLAMLVWLGVYPAYWMRLITASVTHSP